MCCLHAFLKIRQRATRARTEGFEPVREKVWQAYRAPNKRAFVQRLRRLREWAERTLPSSPMKQQTLALCHHRAQYSRRYDHPRAHRTSHRNDYNGTSKATY